MRRRTFIAGLGGAAIVARPLFAMAQEPGRTYRVGVLALLPYDRPDQVGFREALGAQGFVDGQNLIWDRAGYGLRPDQLAAHAAEIVAAKVDVIFAGGDAAIRAAQAATTAIPILGNTDDLVGSGLAQSMSRPGGNTTGMSFLAPQLDSKRQELLLEMRPDAHRIAALADPNTTSEQRLAHLKETARARGVELMVVSVAKLDEIIPAIEAIKASGAAGLNVLASPLFSARRGVIFERTAALGLPAIYQWPEMAQEGGLAAYGPSSSKLYRQETALTLTKLLKGTKPADLPIEQPTKFEMVINLKVAKALNLSIPLAVLARADEVIE
ncbi:MAG: ABC transporter substrate-binding protein [Hyphomicrobiaceae bacterium]